MEAGRILFRQNASSMLGAKRAMWKKSTGCCGGFDIFRYLTEVFLGSFLKFA